MAKLSPEQLEKQRERLRRFRAKMTNEQREAEKTKTRNRMRELRKDAAIRAAHNERERLRTEKSKSDPQAHAQYLKRHSIADREKHKRKVEFAAFMAFTGLAHE